MTCQYEQTLFLGASITGVSCDVGFDQQQSQLTVNLVEDKTIGDEDNPKVEYPCGYRQETTDPDYFYPQDYADKLIGHPAYFKFGNLEFGGLIQNWEANNSIEGKPVYSVILVDPRQILDGVKVITGGYSGSVEGVPNILNVFAHMEGYGSECDHTDSGGFGGAMANEGGMPWNKIKQGIEELTSLGFTGELPNGELPAGIDLDPLDSNITDFGGNIVFKGHSYAIDIGELPILDDNIRISGDQHSLLELIDYVCSSTNHSYFIQLFFNNPDGNCDTVEKYIKVHVVPRTLAPLLGKIQEFIDQETSAGRTVVSNTSGYELRIEPTVSFLVGGPKIQTFEIEQNIYDENNDVIEWNEGYKYNIWPYWGDKVGFDAELPVPNMGYMSSATTNGREKGLKDVHVIAIDITDIPIPLEEFANGSGRVIYPIDVREMRHLLASMDSWLLYMSMNKPAWLIAVETQSFADVKKLQGKLGVANGKEPMIGFADLVTTIFEQIQKRSNAKGLVGDNQRALYRSQILYNYLLEFVNKYYGKTFLVSLPETCVYRESETNKVVTNANPVSSGWVEYNTSILEALGQDLILFRDDEGKLQSFVRYTIDSEINFDPDSSNDFFLETEDAIIYKTLKSNGKILTTVFLPCSVDEKIRFVFPENIGTDNKAYPKAVVTVNSKVTQTYGSANFMAAMTDALIKARADEESLDAAYDVDDPLYWEIKAIIEEDLEKTLKSLNFTDLELGKVDTAIMPEAIALPIKSNVKSYGPWISATGPAGPVNFEQNLEIVPWNYGSEENMNTVANIIVGGGLSAQQVLESGTITFAAAPQVNLGRELLSYGPIVTGIDLRVGTDGIQTTYRMKTYTNRYGVLAKANADRFRRLADANNRIVSNFNTRIKEIKGPSVLRGFGKAEKANRGELMYGIDRRRAGISSKSPHPVICAGVDTYNEKDSGGAWYTSGSIASDQYSRPSIYMSSYSEFISTLNSDNWNHKAFISLDGLFMPFRFGSISSAGSPSSLRTASHFPSTYSNSYETGNEFALGTIPPTPPCLNNSSEFLRIIDGAYVNTKSTFSSGIWQTGTQAITGHNIAMIASGATSPDTDISTRFGAGSMARSIGLRGPVMIAGWGFDIRNRPVPNLLEDSVGRGKSVKFADGFLEKPYLWKAGPLDVRWDERRGMWVAPPPYKKMMVVLDTVPGGPTAIAGVQASLVRSGGNFDPEAEYDADGIELATVDRNIFVVNPFGFIVDTGDSVLVEFDYTNDLDTSNRYVIVNAPMRHYQAA